MSDNAEQVEFEIRVGEETPKFNYPKFYTMSEFLERYGEDNCTIMLQDRERVLFQTKAVELLNAITGPDRYQNVQVALDAWKPCDDRPPTQLEQLALKMLNLPTQAQAVVRMHLNKGIEAQAAEKAAKQAEVAAQSLEKMTDKYTTEDVGEPVTTFQQEPDLQSFEDIGKENDEAVKAAQKGQEPALTENAEDYQAPTEYAEGGTEGVVIEQPPPAPVPDVSS
ncbi:hypothetical protein LCGC14_1137720 [marine sediment metagenome]|uniref:Uncharacterized protein n=1 Tax=marine sediment metagenome TaxID=412755 RepID=A0A0F9Q4X4_9ZZZZ